MLMACMVHVEGLLALPGFIPLLVRHLFHVTCARLASWNPADITQSDLPAFTYDHSRQ